MVRIVAQALTAAPGGTLTTIRDLIAAWPESDELLVVCWRPEAAEAFGSTGHSVLRVAAESTEEALLRLRFREIDDLRRFSPDAVWSQSVRVGGLSAPQAVHYQDIGSFLNIHPNSTRQRLKSIRERRDLARASLRIYNSAALRDAVHARYPFAAAHRNVVVHNGLDLTPFAAMAMRTQSGPTERIGRWVLLPQSDAPHKRNWLAADVLALLQDQTVPTQRVHLTVVGAGDYHDLRSRLADHGLEHTASFAGFVSRERMADLYASHDAVLMTGRAESFGNPIVESHAVGRPIVTPPFAAARELGGPLTSIAEREGARALADALECALRMPLGAAILQEARRFSERFTAHTAARAISVELKKASSDAALPDA